MIHALEHQQILSNSQTIEKVQQSRQESQTVYQQHAASEMRQKELQKQREVVNTNETENLIIKDQESKRDKNRKGQQRNSKADEEMLIQEESEHALDILA